MAKGWKPTTAGGGASAENAGAPSDDPTPTRPVRRRRTQTRRDAEAAAAETPLVQATIAASPRRRTGEKPAPGISGSAGREAIRVQLGDRWSRIVTSVKAGEYTWGEFVETLDDEELARAQLKADDGSFKGRPPSFVPREFLLACQRDQKRRFEEIFSKDVLDMARELVEIARDKANVKPETRLKALQYGMERIFGGIPKDVRVSQEQPWEQMVVNVTSDGQEGMPEHLARRYGGYSERQGGGATEGSD